MKLKLKTGHPGVLLVSLFHAAVGVVFASILAFFGFEPPHVGALAVLNLILAYGLFRMKKWSVKLLVALFLPQVVFGAVTLYFSIAEQRFSSTWETTAFNSLLIMHIAFCFISLVYVSARRKDFE